MRARGRGNSCILVLGIRFWINFLGKGGMDDDEMNDFFSCLPACLPWDRQIGALFAVLIV